MQYDVVEIHKDDVIVGDTILCDDGEIRTVCKGNITYNNFTGRSIFGNNYKLGYIPVKKAINLKF